jgi:hypothetical protein
VIEGEVDDLLLSGGAVGGVRLRTVASFPAVRPS